MTDNVIEWNGVTTLPRDPERVLELAQRSDLVSVVVIGHDKDGNEYFASSEADGGYVLWHMERARHKLIKTVEDLSGE